MRDLAKEVKELIAHPTVVQFFADEKKSLLARIIASADRVTDDIRLAALELKVVLKLQQSLGVIAAKEQFAQQTLAKMKEE